MPSNTLEKIFTQPLFAKKISPRPRLLKTTTLHFVYTFWRNALRKPVPGKTFFECDECGHKWWEPSRDCKSMSGSDCPNTSQDHVYNFASPVSYEEHPEWPTDNSGNLLKDYDYTIER